MRTAKCRCNLCSNPIEFDAADEGRSVSCPHCGMETVLYGPRVAAGEPQRVRRRIDPWKWGAGIALSALGGIIVVLMVAAYRELKASSGAQARLASTLGELTTGLLLVAVVLLVIYTVVMWIVFPIFVYRLLSQIRDLLKSIARANGAVISHSPQASAFPQPKTRHS